MSQHCYHHSNKTPHKEENNRQLGEHSSVTQQQGTMNITIADLINIYYY